MNGIDSAVGNRIRRRRKALGLSQSDLADEIGVKFQQVQKYETGVNRVAASRLWIMAEALQVSITYFFEDLEPQETEEDLTPASATPETSDLIRIFNRLPPAQKSAMSSFLLSLDGMDETEHR